MVLHARPKLHLERPCSASRAILSLFASAQKNLEYRSNLHKKTIVDSTICEVYGSGDETAGHIIVVGPFDVQFKERIGIRLPTDAASIISNSHYLECPQQIPTKHFGTFIAFWQLWKLRNEVLFSEGYANIR